MSDEFDIMVSEDGKSVVIQYVDQWNQPMMEIPRDSVDQLIEDLEEV